MMASTPRRICVISSNPAAAEPRAPRHALAARMAFPEAEVEFIDLAPRAYPDDRPHPLLASRTDIRWTTVRYPTRATAPGALVFRKVRTALAGLASAAFGIVHEDVFGAKAQSLREILAARSADVYIAHNIETLLPAAFAAERSAAALIFDCMEYYSDMGDAQTRVEARAARRLEATWLRRCSLLLASSDDLADALVEEYGIRRPIACYNVPPLAEMLPEKRAGEGINLYWRNSVVGFGQRGLEDLLLAMTLLPADVKLYLQGRAPEDGGDALKARTTELGLGGRVIDLGPYPPAETVVRAAPYDIGLCPERPGPRNHDLTVSNKMFDYHMAGLAVVASDLPSLKNVLQRSGGGVCFRAGDVASLAETIMTLRADRSKLAELQRRARDFALARGNIEFELANIASAMRLALTTGDHP